MTEYTFHDPRPNSIRIYNGDTTEVLRIAKDGVWANPDVPVDEAAQAVLNAVDNLVKQMVSRAVDEERKAAQERIDTLHAMYEQACQQRDALMDQQRAQIAAMRGQIQ